MTTLVELLVALALLLDKAFGWLLIVFLWPIVWLALLVSNIASACGAEIFGPRTNDWLIGTVDMPRRVFDERRNAARRRKPAPAIAIPPGEFGNN